MSIFGFMPPDEKAGGFFILKSQLGIRIFRDVYRRENDGSNCSQITRPFMLSLINDALMRRIYQ